MFLSRFWSNARRKEEFRSLEVRGKLIALKKCIISFEILFKVSVFKALNLSCPEMLGSHNMSSKEFKNRFSKKS